MEITEWQSIEFLCIRPYTIDHILCPYTVGALIFGPERNSDGVAPVTVLDPSGGATLSDFSKGGETDFRRCEGNWVQEFSTPLKAYGQYTLTATGKSKYCDVKTYRDIDSSTGQPRRVKQSCGSPDVVNTDVKYGQVMCQWPYFSNTWKNEFMPFSASNAACQGPDNTAIETYKCSTPVAPRFDGVAASTFQVLNDGKLRTAKWRDPSVTGISGPLIAPTVSVDFTPNEQSTPVGVSGNLTNLPYKTVPSLQAAKIFSGANDAGRRTYSTWDLAFYVAGQFKKPWTVTPTWSFKGNMHVKTVSITSVNWKTGEITKTIQDEYKVLPGSCTGTPIHVNVFKSRISSN